MASVLEVNVPLHRQHQGQLAGIAQFLLAGHSVAAEYAASTGSWPRRRWSCSPSAVVSWCW